VLPRSGAATVAFRRSAAGHSVAVTSMRGNRRAPESCSMQTAQRSPFRFSAVMMYDGGVRDGAANKALENSRLFFAPLHHVAVQPRITAGVSRNGRGRDQRSQ
jgi:hypothetical protein